MSGKKRIYKRKNSFHRWLAIGMALVLLIGQSFPVMAEESEETVSPVSDDEETPEDDADTEETDDGEFSEEGDESDLEEAETVDEIEEVNEIEEIDEIEEEVDEIEETEEEELNTAFSAKGGIIGYTQYDFDVDGFYYKKSADNRVEIVAYRQPSGEDGICVIPTEVTCDNVTYAVTDIGKNAFEGSSLTSVDIPNSVINIEEYAFLNCKDLTDVTIPNGVTGIGSAAFSDCKSLTDITIPSSVTDIGSYAFDGCESLASVIIQDGAKTIGRAAFGSCSNLTGITIPNSVTDIGEDAFWGCGKLDNVVIPDSVTSIEDGVFMHCESLTGIVIPSGVTRIGSSAFSYCGSLQFVSIPDGVTRIDNEAFWDCSALTSITIPSSVTYLGYGALCGCSSLTTLKIAVTVAADGEKKTVKPITLCEDNTYSVFANYFSSNKRNLVFLTEDGTAELSDSTGTFPTLSDARDAYRNDTQDGYTLDNKWCGWDLGEAPSVHTITASAGEGGSISPDGSIPVEDGGMQRFKITSDSGYRLQSVVVDGQEVNVDDFSTRAAMESIENVNYYTFSDVAADHTIRASFEAAMDNSGGGESNSGGDSENPDGGGSSPDNGSGSFNISYEIDDGNITVVNRSSRTFHDDSDNSSQGKEPKTGDTSRVEIYATVAMIAALSYLLLYFEEQESGMTEEKKQELVMILIRWAKKGSYLRRYAALVAIFCILFYYHSIGKRVCVEWKKVYAE